MDRVIARNQTSRRVPIQTLRHAARHCIWKGRRERHRIDFVALLVQNLFTPSFWWLLKKMTSPHATRGARVRERKKAPARTDQVWGPHRGHNTNRGKTSFAAFLSGASFGRNCLGFSCSYGTEWKLHSALCRLRFSFCGVVS